MLFPTLPPKLTKKVPASQAALPTSTVVDSSLAFRHGAIVIRSSSNKEDTSDFEIKGTQHRIPSLLRSRKSNSHGFLGKGRVSEAMVRDSKTGFPTTQELPFWNPFPANSCF
jgi:hypothetical protein